MKQIFLAAVIIVAGCAKKNNQSNSLKFKKNKSLVSEQEARLFDLAIPLDAVVSKDKSIDNFYSYYSSIPVLNLSEFIEQEMESLGWKLVTKFIDKEASLVFEKPFKYSVVSIRPKSGKSVVLFFNSNK